MNIHIIDRNTMNRAKLASAMHSSGFHPEIYEDLAELITHDPKSGIILVEEDQAPSLVEAIKGGACELPLVVYGERPSTEKVVAVMRAGALDYFEWPIALPKLNARLQRIMGEGAHEILKARRRTDARQRIAKLSPREFDVLCLLVDGGSNKSIGSRLGISSRTVEIHRGNLMGKLEARSIADVVRLALYSQVVVAIDDAA